MNYLSLALIYSFAALALLAVVIFVGYKAWNYEPYPDDEAVEPEMEIELPDRGYWLINFTTAIELIEREIREVRREMAGFKKRVEPKIDWWGRVRLWCRNWRPRLGRLVPLSVAWAAATWLLWVLASVVILIKSMALDPGHAQALRAALDFFVILF